MSNSLRKVQRAEERARREIYRPVLGNPFTNEQNTWPRVPDEEALCKALNTAYGAQPNCVVAEEFNEVWQVLAEAENSSRYILFVNRKGSLPNILLDQLPSLCHMCPGECILVGVRSLLPNNAAMILVPRSEPWDLVAALVDNTVHVSQAPWLHNMKYRETPLRLLKIRRD